MALTVCNECYKEISTTADACPHCGCKMRHASGTSGCAWIALAFIIFVVAFNVFD